MALSAAINGVAFVPAPDGLDTEIWYGVLSEPKDVVDVHASPAIACLIAVPAAVPLIVQGMASSEDAKAARWMVLLTSVTIDESVLSAALLRALKALVTITDAKMAMMIATIRTSTKVKPFRTFLNVLRIFIELKIIGR